MAEKLKLAGVVYLAVALIWLGVQIPVRLGGCGGPLSCLASLVMAPFWALIWPIYWPVSDLVPRLATAAVVLLSVSLAAAFALVSVWQRWADERISQEARAKLPPAP
jgi:hypothetical protein